MVFVLETDFNKFLQEIFKLDLQQQIDVMTKYSKKIGPKKRHLINKTSLNSGQFLKIKCLKPIYFSQHHKEAKYLLN